MTIDDIKRKNLILIDYINSILEDYEVKAEYSTNDNDKRVIVVQEQAGQKVVFYGDIPPLFDYYMVNIYGLSIQENKETSVILGNLIGKSVLIDVENIIDNVTYDEKWQIIFKQYTNPQAIMYEDIRRVGYTSTLKCIVNLVARKPQN